MTLSPWNPDWVITESWFHPPKNSKWSGTLPVIKNGVRTPLTSGEKTIQLPIYKAIFTGKSEGFQGHCAFSVVVLPPPKFTPTPSTARVPRVVPVALRVRERPERHGGRVEVDPTNTWMVPPKWGCFPQKWMVKINEKNPSKWMIWRENPVFSETSTSKLKIQQIHLPRKERKHIPPTNGFQAGKSHRLKTAGDCSSQEGMSKKQP